MTRLRAFTTRNSLSNRAFIDGMLESKSLVRFTIRAVHSSGFQVQIEKALREGSIFSSEPYTSHKGA